MFGALIMYLGGTIVKSDPILRHSSDGTPYTYFDIQINKPRDNDQRPAPLYLNCRASKAMAAILCDEAKGAKRGSFVTFTASLSMKTNSREVDGVKKEFTDPIFSVVSNLEIHTKDERDTIFGFAEVFIAGTVSKAPTLCVNKNGVETAFFDVAINFRTSSRADDSERKRAPLFLKCVANNGRAKQLCHAERGIREGDNIFFPASLSISTNEVKGNRVYTDPIFSVVGLINIKKKAVSEVHPQEQPYQSYDTNTAKKTTGANTTYTALPEEAELLTELPF